MNFDDNRPVFPSPEINLISSFRWYRVNQPVCHANRSCEHVFDNVPAANSISASVGKALSHRSEFQSNATARDELVVDE